MSVRPLNAGTSLASLERASNAAYKRRRETMADYHEAEAAFWRSPSAKTQEQVDVQRSEARRAQRAYAKAREAADQARQVAAAA